MESQPTVLSAKPASAGVAFNLAAIAVCVALGGLALAYGLDAVGRQLRADRESPGAPVVITVAGRELAIPRGLLRYDETTSPGFADQVDLRLRLPLGAEGTVVPVDLTLLPRSKLRPSSTMLDGVYLHQFGTEQLDGPPGLIGKPLAGADGFEGETVWYDPINPHPFVAKCDAPVATGARRTCLRAVYFDTVAGIYTFDQAVLANWRAFDREAEAVLATIGVRHTR